ncbi:RXT2-like protein [Xylariomycetidae sp. FL0641]|nr:RXT2-like protein [Xylariomycetidae sp. FL0641]
MASSQQALFADTIRAMKKALKRKAYESDSDSDIDHASNRGNKLKKRARFVHEGQLVPPSGPEVYREVVNHAGFQRAIISRNPPLVDDEGYEIDSDDDEEHIQEVVESAAEFNPYANIQLEKILAPLTSVIDLPTHPTLSRPYTSKTLTELANQGLDVMHKENRALWNVKHLQTKLVGDHIWVPCEMMIGPNDIELYKDGYIERLKEARAGKLDGDILMLDDTHRPNGQSATNGEGAATRDEKAPIAQAETESADTSMVDAEPPVDPDATTEDPSTLDDKTNKEEPGVNGNEEKKEGNQADHQEDKNEDISRNEAENPQVGTIRQTGEDAVTDKGKQPASADSNMANTNSAAAPGGGEESVPNGASRTYPAIREVNEAGSRPVSVGTDSLDEMFIHPLFIAPRSARPDRDVGIPDQEAEDMRRMMQLYVQKQEEVCRGAKKLYEGLLRADRLRKTVLQWSKYEAHAGPNRDMSDGEDWYDKEEWGLEEDLRKGQDEEEEETTIPTKKTRTRR